ncbi:MAG TPA: hypothetical protein VFZ20_09455 [Longimicrobium sp.]|nr:hypothetical protein [Longimicrobium sp.]
MFIVDLSSFDCRDGPGAVVIAMRAAGGAHPDDRSRSARKIGFVFISLPQSIKIRNRGGDGSHPSEDAAEYRGSNRVILRSRRAVPVRT